MTFYIFLIIGFYFSHSLLALNSIKNSLNPYLPNQYYRLLYNIISFLFIISILFSYIKINHKILFYFPGQEIIGLVFITFGSVMSYMAFKSYNIKAFLGLAPENNNTILCTDGMNRFVRHPLYTTGLIILWAALLYEPSEAYFYFAIISSIYLIIGTILEEQKLIEKYGKQYINYKKEVPMLIPMNIFSLKSKT